MPVNYNISGEPVINTFGDYVEYVSDCWEDGRMNYGDLENVMREAHNMGQREVETAILIVPDYEVEGEYYPGNIQPGTYAINELVALLRDQQHNPAAVQFVADMLER